MGMELYGALRSSVSRTNLSLVRPSGTTTVTVKATLGCAVTRDQSCLAERPEHSLLSSSRHTHSPLPGRFPPRSRTHEHLPSSPSGSLVRASSYNKRTKPNTRPLLENLDPKQLHLQSSDGQPRHCAQRHAITQASQVDSHAQSAQRDRPRRDLTRSRRDPTSVVHEVGGTHPPN
jgi:hypothetical protein